jgi:hypothetical protein
LLLLQLLTLVDISDIVPLGFRLALLFGFLALVDIGDVWSCDKYVRIYKLLAPGELLTVPLGLGFALLFGLIALHLVNVGDVVPLRRSFAILDLLGLNGGRTSKASSEPKDGRDSRDAHVEHWELCCVRRKKGESIDKNKKPTIYTWNYVLKPLAVPRTQWTSRKGSAIDRMWCKYLAQSSVILKEAGGGCQVDGNSPSSSYEGPVDMYPTHLPDPTEPEFSISLAARGLVHIPASFISFKDAIGIVRVLTLSPLLSPH